MPPATAVSDDVDPAANAAAALLPVSASSEGPSHAEKSVANLLSGGMQGADWLSSTDLSSMPIMVSGAADEGTKAKTSIARWKCSVLVRTTRRQIERSATHE